MIEYRVEARDALGDLLASQAMMHRVSYSGPVRLMSFVLAVAYPLAVMGGGGLLSFLLMTQILPDALMQDGSVAQRALVFVGIVLGYAVFSATWPRVKAWLSTFNRLPPVPDGDVTTIRADDTGLYFEAENATSWIGWKAMDAVLVFEDRLYVIAAMTGRSVPFPSEASGDRESLIDLVSQNLTAEAHTLSNTLQSELASSRSVQASR